jgi:AcrR family transcriptional regulator
VLPENKRLAQKTSTRESIARHAALLFDEHGFDGVTVEQIAIAAGVTKKTVFNHFPTKEDLALDRATKFEQTILNELRDQCPGSDVVDAFRCLSHSNADKLATQRKHGGHSRALFHLIDATPALQARLAIDRQRLIDAVAGEIRNASPHTEPSSWPQIAATALVTAHITLFQRLRELAESSVPVRNATASYHQEVDAVFDRLTSGWLEPNTRSTTTR